MSRVIQGYPMYIDRLNHRAIYGVLMFDGFDLLCGKVKFRFNSNDSRQGGDFKVERFEKRFRFRPIQKVCSMQNILDKR